MKWIKNKKLYRQLILGKFYPNDFIIIGKAPVGYNVIRYKDLAEYRTACLFYLFCAIGLIIACPVVIYDIITNPKYLNAKDLGNLVLSLTMIVFFAFLFIRSLILIRAVPSALRKIKNRKITSAAELAGYRARTPFKIMAYICIGIFGIFVIAFIISAIT